MAGPKKRAPHPAGYARTTPKQSNHDGCRLPDGLSVWQDEPLYLLVARWCRMQQGWVGRKEIALAFQITERRASFQISYLTRKPELIRCGVRRVRNEGAPNSSYEVWVHDVYVPGGATAKAADPAVRKPAGSSRRRVGNADSSVRDLLSQLWPKPRREEDK
ncbi:CaiF/GrlA family transcriptional regulator [Salmonella enterica]|uniref:CaiF/GrlA family transcriptional regulator n=1 Tax=Salmonella enterica subsp. enterica serovar Miami TaxID=286780 RepID=A0A753AIC5_SALET|nr:CaiF/GrlA family transcriptional regulator [Salmonella enterica]ECD0159143.1 CaiF/GrlA family transcriptional regulator [Salmonella enterica subsp. enterica]ECD4441648.1 CaiF/GrlA family transcriptional regulator [Salmonella enterica subsp. enterica serovar Florida]ECS7319236.1 CaiF/GrlA family transcriptional regulator [Salmonella enterica subsp. enterica serovar Miami str. CFSAN000579]ECX3455638.1 CaiF/GrlA family transcriptional regulator [Salmonella enterica subsp. enterica serovar Rubis